MVLVRLGRNVFGGWNGLAVVVDDLKILDLEIRAVSQIDRGRIALAIDRRFCFGLKAEGEHPDERIRRADDLIEFQRLVEPTAAPEKEMIAGEWFEGV